MSEGVRIQKALADAGVASRRAAEGLVAAGRVTVNGVLANPGQRVDPRTDRIALDGRPVVATARHVYLAMAKPSGVTSTVADRHAERTVLDLVPPDLAAGARLYPVGRLDRDSEGLLLLTNDGAWAQRLLHPRYGVDREYAVGLRDPLRPDQVEQLREGILLDEGLARLDALRPASRSEAHRLDARAPGDPLRWYLVVIRQGWKRQVRRMLAAVGAPVSRLVRVRIGSLRLGDLAPGEVRALTAAERERLTGRTPGEGSSHGTRGSTEGPTVALEDPPVAADDPVGRDGPVVALDGPGSSGKSSVGAEVARRIGWRFLDTGILYRALAWLCATRAIDPDDDAALLPLVPELELVADGDGRVRRVRVGGRDVTDELHAPEVDRLVSRVAARAPLRAALLDRQRALAAAGRIIVAGRDIGTVVLPDADLKVYLDVSLEERARRRAAERDVEPDSEEGRAILDDLRRRDRTDSTRETAPLRIPDDAVLVRSDDRTFEETVAIVERLVRERVPG